MRINCGPTWAERTLVRETARRKYLTQWHPFFCLLPRRVGNQCVWLEYIQRKGRQDYKGYHLSWYFEYRFNPIEEMFREI
jgi:hypothetical protein